MKTLRRLVLLSVYVIVANCIKAQDIKFEILDSVICNDCSGYHKIPAAFMKITFKKVENSIIPKYRFNYRIPNIIESGRGYASADQGFYYTLCDNSGDTIYAYSPFVEVPVEGNAPLEWINPILQNDTSILLKFYVNYLAYPFDGTFIFRITYGADSSSEQYSMRSENISEGFLPIDESIKSNIVLLKISNCKDEWAEERKRRLGVHRYFYKLYPTKVQNKVYKKRIGHIYKCAVR